MSSTEDYLDGLLSSISQKKSNVDRALDEDEKNIQAKIADMNSVDPNDDFMSATGVDGFVPREMTHDNLREAFSESDFLKDFESELGFDSSDSFIEEFEKEIDDEEAMFERGEEIPDDEFIRSLMEEDDIDASSEDYAEDYAGNVEVNMPSDSNFDNSPSDIPPDIEVMDLESIDLDDSGVAPASVDYDDDAIEDTFVTIDDSFLGDDYDSDGKKSPKKQEADADFSGTAIASGTASPNEKASTSSDETDSSSEDASADDVVESIEEQSEEAADELLSALGEEEAKASVNDEVANDEDIQNILSEVESIVNEDSASEESILPSEYQSDEHDDIDALEVNEDGVSLVDENADLDDLLMSEEGMSDIGQLLDADENDIELDESRSAFEASASEAEKTIDEQGALGEEDAPKLGFIQKILSIFKRGDKEDPSAAADELLSIANSDEAVDTSAENQKILEELDEEEKAALDKKEAKAQAKAEKKAAKKAAKEEKAAAKGEKPKKEKKPGALKTFLEDDKSKKIPPKVLLIFVVLVATVVVGVLLLSNVYNKKSSIKSANAYYAAGEYIDAYNVMTGLSGLNDSESQMLAKARILADLQNKKAEYDVFMQKKDYENALDALIIAVGRYNENLDEAKRLGVNAEYNGIESMIAGQLMDQFGISDEEANELYEIKGRTKYTVALNEKLKALGMDNSDSDN